MCCKCLYIFHLQFSSRGTLKAARDMLLKRRRSPSAQVRARSDLLRVPKHPLSHRSEDEDKPSRPKKKNQYQTVTTASSTHQSPCEQAQPAMQQFSILVSLTSVSHHNSLTSLFIFSRKVELPPPHSHPTSL